MRRFPARPLVGLIIFAISLVDLRSTVADERNEKTPANSASQDKSQFDRGNLVAWCIVPFDGRKRTPEQRAVMLQDLGIKRLAYDWRTQHVPEFEREILACRKHGVEFFAFWGMHDAAFELFAKYKLQPQIWQTAPSPKLVVSQSRVEQAARQLAPAVKRTLAAGCQFGLYNHGGWGGQPENLVAVCRLLRQQHQTEDIGIVYNLHHAHDQLMGFESTLKTMQPYLYCLNLNGMTENGDQRGQKILPLGAGDQDSKVLQIILDSDYDGPLGIIGHTQDDVKLRLQDNLDGLQWLTQQATGKTKEPRPKYRTWSARKPQAAP